MSLMPNPPELPPEGKSKLGDRIVIPRSAIKSQTIESITPIHLSEINTSHVWTFSMKSRADQYVRFNPESLSMVVYGTYANPTRDEGSAVPETAAVNHALRARSNLPPMFILPTVQGSGFIQRVEVLINGVKVGTNDGLGSHLQHYAHASNVYCSSPPTPYIATNKDIANTRRTDKTEAMTIASKPFDYNNWNATIGTRIPAYLYGVFPFDTKNRTRISTTKEDPEAMYFPPETEFTIKFFLNQSKRMSLFNLTGCTMPNYFNDDVAGIDQPVHLTFQTVELSFECVTMKGAEQLAIANKLGKTTLSFPYDIAKIQYQTLQAGAAITQTIFQIPPEASILYVLFLKSWQVQFTPAAFKPVSPLSRFPHHCTEMQMSFGNEPHLIVHKMNDFGQRPTVSQDISILNFYRHLKQRNFFSKNFETLFPNDADTDSYVQAVVTDLSSLSSKRTDQLKIFCQFAGAEKSPTDTIILVMTVHPTGLATCKDSIFWEFKDTSA